MAFVMLANPYQPAPRFIPFAGKKVISVMRRVARE
jgi:hypothetical protein